MGIDYNCESPGTLSSYSQLYGDAMCVGVLLATLASFTLENLSTSVHGGDSLSDIQIVMELHK